MSVHNLTAKELVKMAQGVGYVVHEGRGKGSHVRLYKEGHPPITLPKPRKRQVSRNAARDTLKKIQSARKSKAA